MALPCCLRVAVIIPGTAALADPDFNRNEQLPVGEQSEPERLRVRVSGREPEDQQQSCFNLKQDYSAVHHELIHLQELHGLP